MEESLPLEELTEVAFDNGLSDELLRRRLEETGQVMVHTLKRQIETRHFVL